MQKGRGRPAFFGEPMRSVSLKVSKSDYDKLTLLADADRRSTAFIARDAVHEFLERHDAEVRALQAKQAKLFVGQPEFRAADPTQVEPLLAPEPQHLAAPLEPSSTAEGE
jgi:predicted transcriptional regulator